MILLLLIIRLKEIDLHELLEAGKYHVTTKGGNRLNFEIIVHEVKEDLFKSHIKNVGKNRVSNADLLTSAEYDKTKVIEMEQTILMMKRQLIIANEQKIKIDANQAKDDFRYKSALAVAGIFD